MHSRLGKVKKEYGSDVPFQPKDDECTATTFGNYI